MNNSDEQQEDKTTVVPGSYMLPPGYRYVQDEINLVDLWKFFLKRVKTIFLITGVVTLIAAVYAFYSPNIYLAEVNYLPPTLKDIQPLNLQVGNVYLSPNTYHVEAESIQSSVNDTQPLSVITESAITVDSVYASFLLKLGSKRLMRQYFDDYKIAALLASNNESRTTEELFRVFIKQLNVVSNRKSPKIVNLQVEWPDAEVAAKIANEFGLLAERETVKELVSDLKMAIAVRIKNINNLINSKREIALKRLQDKIIKLQESNEIQRADLSKKIVLLKKRESQKREDRIVTLQENLLIAKKLDIHQSSLSLILENDTTEGVVSSVPLYMYGTEILEAEIETLKLRKDDAPFISKIRDLESQLEYLSHNNEIEILKKRKGVDSFVEGIRDLEEQLISQTSVKINENQLRAAIIDQKASPSAQRIKPKRKLIVILGLVLGLMLGIFSAFVQNYLERQHENQQA